MLQITIPERELWDEVNGQFLYTKPQTLQLEHSLVSVSKWESKWCKPFLSKEPKSGKELSDYIRCMTLTQNVDPNVYDFLTPQNFEDIKQYIDAPMTATTFSKLPNESPGRKIITSELIYYWMITFNIPVEFQKWHLNRLLTLIKVCDRENAPPKKMSKHDLYSRNAAVNARNRKRFNSKG